MNIALPEVLRFTIPGVPVPKDRPRVTMHGTFTPKKTKSYQHVAAWYARAAMGAKPPLEGPLTLTVFAYLPIPASWSKKKQAAAAAGAILPTAKPDVDNLAKAISDALNKVCYADDAQVVRLLVEKRFSGDPRAVVLLSKYHSCDEGVMPT